MSASSFHQKAAQADAFAIDSARLALERSNSPAVRNFAQKLITTHEKSESALNQGGGPVVAGPAMNQNQQQMLNQLKNVRGRNFDQKFKRVQIQANQNAIRLYKSFSATGGDQSLARVARQTLPTLKSNLATAQNLQIP